MANIIPISMVHMYNLFLQSIVWTFDVRCENATYISTIIFLRAYTCIRTHICIHMHTYICICMSTLQTHNCTVYIIIRFLQKENLTSAHFPAVNILTNSLDRINLDSLHTIGQFTHLIALILNQYKFERLNIDATCKFVAFQQNLLLYQQFLHAYLIEKLLYTYISIIM